MVALVCFGGCRAEPPVRAIEPGPWLTGNQEPLSPARPQVRIPPRRTLGHVPEIAKPRYGIALFAVPADRLLSNPPFSPRWSDRALRELEDHRANAAVVRIDAAPNGISEVDGPKPGRWAKLGRWATEAQIEGKDLLLVGSIEQGRETQVRLFALDPSTGAVAGVGQFAGSPPEDVLAAAVAETVTACRTYWFELDRGRLRRVDIEVEQLHSPDDIEAFLKGLLALETVERVQHVTTSVRDGRADVSVLLYGESATPDVAATRWHSDKGEARLEWIRDRRFRALYRANATAR